MDFLIKNGQAISGLVTYRVCGEEKGSFSVIGEDQIILRAELKGKFHFEQNLWPSIGDWVSGLRQPGDWVLIDETLPRTNALQRKDPNGSGAQIFASNVDYMFVVTSANQDLNENRLDRYLAMAVSCEITPVVIVNKIELVENAEEILTTLRERFSNWSVHAISVYENFNKDILNQYLGVGKTAVIVGSSGVGKSSLVNWLLDQEVLITSGIREDDGRGRHTTTHRSLHKLKTGGVVIDTPGIRTLGLVDAEEGVNEVFADLKALTSRCKFSDCRHTNEPACAIRESLENGELDESRWENYLKLQREVYFEMRKTDKKAQSEQKKLWAQRNKDARKATKHKKSSRFGM